MHVALLSEQVEQAQELLKWVEESAKQIGLEMNAKKTKCLSFNHSEKVEVMIDNGTSARSGQGLQISWSLD